MIFNKYLNVFLDYIKNELIKQPFFHFFLYFGNIHEIKTKKDYFIHRQISRQERMTNMPRKGENIYKRKDGRWEGRYKKGRKENGQLKYGYIYGKTYGDVKHRLYTYKLKYQTLIQLKGEAAISYEDWAFSWMHDHQQVLKSSTYHTYFYKLTHYIFPLIGHISLNELDDSTIQQAIDTWQSQGLKATTIHVLYQILKKSLNEAYVQRKILHAPCQRIQLPKKKRNKGKALSKYHQSQLEKEAKTRPLYQGLPVLLALHAGLRIGEIAALHWDDIDLDQRTIHIRRTYQRVPLMRMGERTQLVLDQAKTDCSNRTIPMTYTLYKYLRRWKKKAPGPFVCSNKQKPTEPRVLTYYFHKIRQKCALFSVNFHQLRHTFATRCIEAKGDVASVSKLLGHTSTQTTLDIYTDSFLESRKQVIQQMEQAK